MNEPRLLVVREPWSWFWMPAGMNPATREAVDSTRDYADSKDVDWRAVVETASLAVTEAQLRTEVGQLDASVAVFVESPLPDREWSVVESWVGHGSEQGVTVRLDVDRSTFIVEDGRHRLWGAATITQRPRHGFDPGEGVQTAAGPVRIPVRDDLLAWARHHLATPDSDLSDWIDDLERQADWWLTTAPEPARGYNSDHLAQLRWMTAWSTTQR